MPVGRSEICFFLISFLYLLTRTYRTKKKWGGGGMKTKEILIAAFRPSRAVNRKNYFYLKGGLG